MTNVNNENVNELYCEVLDLIARQRHSTENLRIWV